VSEQTDPRKILYAEFTAKPGNEVAVAELVRAYARLVRAEPGNVAFSATRKRANPAAFFVYEEYTDQDAFTTHVGAPYGAIFNDALADLIVEDGSVLTFLMPV